MEHFGTLTVYAYTSDARIPLSGAEVTVKRDLSADAPIIAALTTDADGYTAPLRLETPALAESCCPGQATPYAAVSITVRLKGYETQSAEGVQIFPDTDTVQGFRMIPAPSLPYDRAPYDTPAQNL
ncbi:MAG: spore cortex-lytic protein [Oscillospiraceae bacterium]|nr:spore cortex-lytic protein [Oscillospiraceae bacterium]